MYGSELKKSALKDSLWKKRLREVSSYTNILSTSAQVTIRRILIRRAVWRHGYLGSSRGTAICTIRRRGGEAARSREALAEER